MWVDLEGNSLGMIGFLGIIPEELRKTTNTLKYYTIGPKKFEPATPAKVRKVTISDVHDMKKCRRGIVKLRSLLTSALPAGEWSAFRSGRVIIIIIIIIIIAIFVPPDLL
jgi:hypothetical protein